MDYNRRSVLASLAGIASGEWLPVDDDRRGPPEPVDPPDSATVRNVSVFDTSPTTILDTEWIVHTFGWKTEPGEAKNELTRILENPEYEFKIDQHQIENPHQYWTNIRETEDFYHLRWEYPVSPAQFIPGTHTFEIRIDFDGEFESQSAPQARTWSGSDHLSTKYEIMNGLKLTLQDWDEDATEGEQNEMS